MHSFLYAVRQSTSFSRLLQWEFGSSPGGFDMRARGIASQCVLLDYPGCKKHWDREGIPTGVNED